MRIEIYRRKDEKFGWRQVGGNGEILSGDANQGFENRDDCVASAKLATGAPFRFDVDIEVVYIEQSS